MTLPEMKINPVVAHAVKETRKWGGLALSAAILMASSSLTNAADATWLATPADNDFRNDANWSTGVVPGSATSGNNDIATFSASSITTLSVSTGSSYLGGIDLVAAGTGYIINFDQANTTLILDGAGIGTGTNFLTINLDAGFTLLRFDNNASAGEGDINVNTLFSSLRFFDNSTAGSVDITNSHITDFADNSSLNNGFIFNTSTGITRFEDASNAGAGVIQNSGVLSFEDNSNAGSATVTTNSGGVTNFLGSTSSSNSQQIVSLGGTLDISGLTSSQINIGSIAGAGDFVLGSKDAFVGFLNTNTEFSGVISGGTGGYLYKIGTGSLTLSGVNTYIGNTIVNNGILFVNGSINSNVITQAAGTLAGTGSVNSVNIQATGTHTPGVNSIGTQTLNGFYVNIGTLQIEVDDAPNSDKVIVNGAVNITGAALDVQELPGSFGVIGDIFNYTIVENDGADAVTGTFGSITNTQAFLDASVDYAGGDGNDIVLTLTHTAGAIVTAAQTPNQQAVSQGLSTGFDFAADPNLSAALSGLTAAQAPMALDMLSGEVHASTVQIMANHGTQMSGMASERLWSLSDNGAGGGGSQTANLGLRGSSASLHHNNVTITPVADVSDAEPQPFAMWVRGYGKHSKLKDDGNAGRLKSKAGGVVLGGDVALAPDLRVGIMGNWGSSSGEVKTRLSAFKLYTAGISAYVGYAPGSFLLKGYAGYAHHDVETRRSIVFGGLNRSAKADYNANQAIVFGEAAYRIEMEGVSLMPLASLGWSTTDANSFTEKGAGLTNLSSKSRNFDRLESTLGLRMATTIETDTLTFLPQAQIGWVHSYGNLAPKSNFTFAGGGDFQISGVSQARNALKLGAGLNVSAGTSLTGFIDYAANLSKRGHDHAFSGGFRFRF